MPELPPTASHPGTAFERVVAIMRRLRAPDGCPWDRAQTFDSIRTHTLEETYETLEAIGARDWPALREELGDLLLQVVFYAGMAEERGLFDITGVLETLAAKLVRRHPHVFEDASGHRMSAAEALGRWEQVKAAEKGGASASASGGEAAPASLLGGMPAGLPALAAAARLGRKAAAAGFDWSDAAQTRQKIDEELAELETAVASPAADDDTAASAREEELGDLLFTVVNLARHLGAEPESALQRANRKFRRRFEWMEAEARRRGREFHTLGPGAQDELWRAAKSALASSAAPPAGTEPAA